MKHPPNPRRGRLRGNGKRFSQPKHQNFESNGADVKIRGTAQQVSEKYLALARDSASAGDRIAAENHLQFAEHYYRVAQADRAAAERAAAERAAAGNNPGRGHNKPAPEQATGHLTPVSPSPAAEQPEVALPEAVQPEVVQPEKLETEAKVDSKNKNKTKAKAEAEAAPA